MLKANGSLRSWFSLLCVGCSLCALLCLQRAFAQQAAPHDPSGEKTQRALSDLADGNPDPMDAKVLADANVARAIPTLEKKFLSADNPYPKAQYAAALVKLHAESPLYWKYVSEKAEDILKDPLPTSAISDEMGMRRAVPTGALGQWAKRHQVTESEAFAEATLVGVAFLPVLASTGDQRAVPLLERALATDNYFLHEGAIIGLVSLGDEGSVDAIAAALKRDPPPFSNLAAHLLFWSSSPAAQQLAATYLTKEELDALQTQKAARKAVVRPVTP